MVYRVLVTPLSDRVLPPDDAASRLDEILSDACSALASNPRLLAMWIVACILATAALETV